MSLISNRVQFVRAEAFSKRGSAKNPPIRAVMGEIHRKKGYSTHVLAPSPPILVHRSAEGETMAVIAARTKRATELSGRKVDRTRLTLLGGIASFPELGDRFIEEPELLEEYDKWKKLTLDFLELEYGDDLIEVWEHDVDEPRPHLHFLCVPSVRADGRFTATDLHPGISAKRRLAKEGATGAEQQAGYRAAMSEYQNRFHVAVGIPMGWNLTSANPRPRRNRAEQERQKEIEELEVRIAQLKGEQVKASKTRLVRRTPSP